MLQWFQSGIDLKLQICLLNNSFDHLRPLLANILSHCNNVVLQVCLWSVHPRYHLLLKQINTFFKIKRVEFRCGNCLYSSLDLLNHDLDIRHHLHLHRIHHSLHKLIIWPLSHLFQLIALRVKANWLPNLKSYQHLFVCSHLLRKFFLKNVALLHHYFVDTRSQLLFTNLGLNVLLFVLVVESLNNTLHLVGQLSYPHVFFVILLFELSFKNLNLGEHFLFNFNWEYCSSALKKGVWLNSFLQHFSNLPLWYFSSFKFQLALQTRKLTF